MKLRSKISLVLLLCLSPILLVFGTAFVDGIRVKPRGVVTVGDHFRRFGPPQHAWHHLRDGREWFELSGPPAHFWQVFSLSGLPAYLYDDTGHLVDWCADITDTPRGWSHRSDKAAKPITAQDVRRKFQL
jgi:hypothetical protein